MVKQDSLPNPVEALQDHFLTLCLKLKPRALTKLAVSRSEKCGDQKKTMQACYLHKNTPLCNYSGDSC